MAEPVIKRDTRQQVSLRLENLVRKAKNSCRGADEVECKVFPPNVHGHPYMVEVSLSRFVRRVSVDSTTVQHLNLGQPDPGLMRELRTAILAVYRLGSRR